MLDSRLFGERGFDITDVSNAGSSGMEALSVASVHIDLALEVCFVSSIMREGELTAEGE